MTYSGSLAMSRQTYAQRHRTIVARERSTVSLGPISSILVVVLLSVLLGLLYLTQITKTNAYSNKLSDLRGQQTALREEYDNLEVEGERLKSLENAKQAQVAQGMVDIQPSAYVQN